MTKLGKRKLYWEGCDLVGNPEMQGQHIAVPRTSWSARREDARNWPGPSDKEHSQHLFWGRAPLRVHRIRAI